MNLVDSNQVQNNNLMVSEAASERTLYPYVTGTSVIGIKYKDGILMAADMGGSYGSTLRYKSVERLKSIGKHSLLGASGEISDFQEILRNLDELILYDNMWDDGNSMGPKEVHNYLTRMMYNRRNKFNPLWNSLVLGGVKNGQKYLGTVNMIGVHFEDDHVATGFGNHLARPILRDEWHANLSFEDGVKLLEKCMRVLLYRDRSAINKLQIAKITEEGVTISQPYALKTFWNFAAFQNPTVGAEGSCFLGKMSFNDDEPIVASQDVSGGKPAAFLAGKTKLKIINKTTAPLEESEFKVMLELTGAGSGNDRSGVDLVTVLDVSNSMKGEKLEKMKIAMLFMIKKLSPIDRLSIVTFNTVSRRLSPLRQITENSQREFEYLINSLVANGGTNISAGLQTGLKVLNDYRLTSGREVGIMLLSDGQQNEGGDAAQVLVGNVPVYTFGFGADHDPTVLNAIANNSMGGTFSDVRNQDNLSIAFSQCLAGLLTVVVQDLKLTVTAVESTILNVFAGNYPQSKDYAAGSVTVSFDNLYNKEVRKVIVDLLLPVASSLALSNILNITYTYSSGGKLFEANPIIVNISRTGWTSVEPEREEVMIEEIRRRTAQMIKESRVMADDKKLGAALKKLAEARNLLDNVVNDESNPLIEMLKSELQQMSMLMTTQEIYEKQGRPFALSFETSHNRQRFATRGDDAEKLRLFATPRMDAYLEQAKSFEEDPSKPLPSVDEDEKQDVAADPLACVL